MSKQESRMFDLYNQIRIDEEIYNSLFTKNEIWVNINSNVSTVVDDKEIIELIKKFYAKKLNKLKKELKQELDKKL